jgi:ArsR family transcriptional regulator
VGLELELAPKRKRAKGEVCCEPFVFPEVDGEKAAAIATAAKALGDPIRVQTLEFSGP